MGGHCHRQWSMLRAAGHVWATVCPLAFCQSRHLCREGCCESPGLCVYSSPEFCQALLQKHTYACRWGISAPSSRIRSVTVCKEHLLSGSNWASRFINRTPASQWEAQNAWYRGTVSQPCGCSPPEGLPSWTSSASDAALTVPAAASLCFGVALPAAGRVLYQPRVLLGDWRVPAPLTVSLCPSRCLFFHQQVFSSPLSYTMCQPFR